MLPDVDLLRLTVNPFRDNLRLRRSRGVRRWCRLLLGDDPGGEEGPGARPGDAADRQALGLPK